MTPPTLDDIRAARAHVYAAMAPSPLLRHPLLAEALGADVYVKHENHNPTGAFKVRGGLNLIGAPVRATIARAASSRRRPAITASRSPLPRRGPACRARWSCRVGNNPGKNALMRAWGADGHRARARTSTRRASWWSGCAAARPALRALRQRARPHQRRRHVRRSRCSRRSPTSTPCSCPIGGGSGACGLITVRDALGLKTRIVGVGAERAERGRAVVADRHAHRRHVGRHVCRRRGDARHLRPDVWHPAARPRRLRAAERRGTGRGRADGAARSRTTWPKAPAAPRWRRR